MADQLPVSFEPMDSPLPASFEPMEAGLPASFEPMDSTFPASFEPMEQPSRIPGVASEILQNLIPFPGAKVIKTMWETPVPGVGRAAEYLGGKVTGLEESIMGAGEKLGLPPPVAAAGAVAAMLPSELAVSLLEGARTVGGLGLTLVSPFIPVSGVGRVATRAATPEQVANLAAAIRGVKEAAEGVTAATLGARRLISAPKPTVTQLGQMPAAARLATQEANLAAAVESVAKARVSPSALVIEKALGPETADLVAPKLAAMPPEEAARNAAEMAKAAAGPNPLVKPITDAPTAANVNNLIARMARPRLESEQNLLGLNYKAAEAWEATANELIRKRALGEVLTPKEGQIAMETVAEAVATGEFSPQTGAAVLGYDLGTTAGKVEFAAMLEESGSLAGFTLAQISKSQSALLKAFKDVPELKTFFRRMELKGVPLTPNKWDKVADLIRLEENIRRAGLISAPATAITNAISQAEFTAANLYEDLVSGVAGAAVGKIPLSSVLDDAAADVMGFLGKLSPARQAELNDVLAKFPYESRRLLNTASADVSLDQTYTRIMTVMNSWQDRFFARAAADAYMRQSATRTGRTIQQLTETEVRQAVDHARRITYSSSPRSPKTIQIQRRTAVQDYFRMLGKPKEQLTDFDLETAVAYSKNVVPDAQPWMDTFGGAVLDLYKKLPFLPAIGPTFPKFALNAIQRIYTLSPIPLFRPSTYAAVANPDPRVAFKAISQVMTGTTYFGAGYAMAAHGMWGDKLSEVNGPGGRQYNMLKYAPIGGQMLAGRMLYDYQQDREFGLMHYSKEDMLQAFTSLRKDDMGKVPLLDLVDDNASGKARMGAFMRMLDSFAKTLPPRLLGSFPRDVVAVPGGEAAKQRYIRDRHIIDPIKDQIPLWGQDLPEAYSPIREGPLMRGETTMERALRLAGFVGRKKTPVESELDRLGVRPRELWPRTGMEDWDYAATKVMGKVASHDLGQLIEKRFYKLMDPKLKKLVIETELNLLKSEAKKVSKDTKERAVYDYVKSRTALDEELLRRALKTKGIGVPE